MEPRQERAYEKLHGRPLTEDQRLLLLPEPEEIANELQLTGALSIATTSKKLAHDWAIVDAVYEARNLIFRDRMYTTGVPPRSSKRSNHLRHLFHLRRRGNG